MIYKLVNSILASLAEKQIYKEQFMCINLTTAIWYLSKQFVRCIFIFNATNWRNLYYVFSPGRNIQGRDPLTPESIGLNSTEKKKTEKQCICELVTIWRKSVAKVTGNLKKERSQLNYSLPKLTCWFFSDVLYIWPHDFFLSV